MVKIWREESYKFINNYLPIIISLDFVFNNDVYCGVRIKFCYSIISSFIESFIFLVPFNQKRTPL